MQIVKRYRYLGELIGEDEDKTLHLLHEDGSVAKDGELWQKGVMARMELNQYHYSWRKRWLERRE